MSKSYKEKKPTEIKKTEIEEDEAEDFYSVLQMCDLKIVNLRNDLRNYIKQEESKGILKIMLMKLTYYYRTRYFGEQIDR